MTNIFQSIKALFQGNKSIVATDETIQKIVQSQIKRLGNQADLNHIDVSQVTDMCGLFEDSPFNGDISKWDVSNVKDMSKMFGRSQFNGDISQWNVSKVRDMAGMFFEGQFNGDVSKWKVSKTKNMTQMFACSEFNGDVSQWDVAKVEDMGLMFGYSKFNGNLSQWRLFNELVCLHALHHCPAAVSEHVSELHFACKAEDSDLELHPKAQAAWDSYAPVAKSMGLEGPALGRAVWTSYQASLKPQAAPEALEGFDFSM